METTWTEEKGDPQPTSEGTMGKKKTSYSPTWAYSQLKKIIFSSQAI